MGLFTAFIALIATTWWGIWYYEDGTAWGIFIGALWLFAFMIRLGGSGVSKIGNFRMENIYSGRGADKATVRKTVTIEGDEV